MEIGSYIEISEADLASFGLDIDTITKDLTLPNPEYKNIMRFGKGRFYKKVEPNICYLKKIPSDYMHPTRYILPRYYNGIVSKLSSAYMKSSGNAGKLLSSTDFKGCLRDYQEDFYRDYEDHIQCNTGILIEAGCGSGKTVLAIYIALKRKVKTMVLVPTYYLAQQWSQRISEFAPDCTQTLLTAKDKEIRTDSDFTIICMDLFSVRLLPEELVKNVGHVILDEAHRVGAETYLPILDEIPATYRTALTATFRRSDGVHKILAYHFGVHLRMESRFPKPTLYGFHTGVEVGNVISKNKSYQRFLEYLQDKNLPYSETKSCVEFKTNGKILMALAKKDYLRGLIKKVTLDEIKSCVKRGTENISYTTVESYLSENSKRRKLLISLIRECLDGGRTVLFLSKRKDVLKSLAKVFSAYKPMVIVSETNKRSDEENEYLQKECRLIFGVTQLAKEGLDIDRLDTLILHLPIKDTEQAVGRISRLCEGKKKPVCLYLLDRCPITYAVFNNAQKYIKINAEPKGNISFKDLDRIL